MIGRVMGRLRENSPRGKEDLRMQVTRKIWSRIRSSMQLRKDMGLNLWSKKIKEVV